MPALGYVAVLAFPYLSLAALAGYVGFGAGMGLTYATAVHWPTPDPTVRPTT